MPPAGSLPPAGSFPPAATVLIDGPSCSGKTTLAVQLSQRIGDRLRLDNSDLECTVLHLDDAYPGWSGLRAGALAVTDGVLLPRAAGRSGWWRRFDWERNVPAGLERVPPGGVLLVEGCGAINARSAPLADCSIWVDAAPDERRRRATQRPGWSEFAPHWDSWAAQERRFFAEQRPMALADVRLDGAESIAAMPGVAELVYAAVRRRLFGA